MRSCFSNNAVNQSLVDHIGNLVVILGMTLRNYEGNSLDIGSLIVSESSLEEFFIMPKVLSIAVVELGDLVGIVDLLLVP